MYRVLLADNDNLSQEALKIMISRIDGFEVSSQVDSLHLGVVRAYLIR